MEEERETKRWGAERDRETKSITEAWEKKALEVRERTRMRVAKEVMMKSLDLIFFLGPRI